MRVLEPFFNDFDPSYSATRNKARDVLQQEDALTEIVQLVGKESLSEDQKVVMEVAKIIREDFLQQNAFTDYDFTCPLVKSVGMLKCIMVRSRRPVVLWCFHFIQTTRVHLTMTWVVSFFISRPFGDRDAPRRLPDRLT